MSDPIDLDNIKSYFGEKLETYGATPRGTDWNSETSQEVRFDQILKVCDFSREFSILDYGCGYGALIPYLDAKGCKFSYAGFDVLEPMVVEARRIFQGRPNCTFTSHENELQPGEYAVASGIFNIRLQYSYEAWTEYALQVLHKMNALSSKGFSFNMLTKYSDADHMRPDLYYADPCFIFDYCKTHFSRNVALLHDYTLYDFTVLVRKQA